MIEPPDLLRAGRRYTLRGQAYGQSYDYECSPVLVTPDEAKLRTESDPPHTVTIRPRYVGAKLGDRETEPPTEAGTVCALSFDGDYVALALWVEQLNGDVLVIPSEY